MMSTTVFVVVLGAAILHATWNALVKHGADKRAAMGAVVIGHAPLALLALFLVPWPHPHSLPFMVGGVALHVGYQIFLMRSYESGDLTQVYPIARGSAPLMVALFSVLVLGVHLERAEVLAIAIIGIGILSLALCGARTGSATRTRRRWR